MGCAEEDVEVALCRAVPFIDADDDPCPPTRYVTVADVLDSALAPELEFTAPIELKSLLMVALEAAEVDSTVLVPS